MIYEKQDYLDPFENGEYVKILPQSSENCVDGMDTPYYPSIRNIQWSREFKGFKKVLYNKNSLMLFIIPFSFLSHIYSWDAGYVFILNFLALIPLSSIIGQSTEELALHTGDIIGGLINASFGNIVEMILSFQTLQLGLIDVVQGTLLGSILSNLLLVLGMSFFFGGIFHHVQKFNAKGATCGTSLLLLSSLGVVIPTIVAIYIPGNIHKVLQISRVSAIFIGFTYFCFLFFQLYTHFNLFQAENSSDLNQTPECTFIPFLLLLIIATILVSFLSEYLTSTIEPVVNNYGLSKSFIGIILLPIVGNAAEHMSAVSVAIKNKPDLTIGIAIGSSVQVALLVVPFTVISGWILDQPMTLAFSPVSGIILIISIFVTTGIVSDGESNWLEGLMLITAYLIVSVVFFLL